MKWRDGCLLQKKHIGPAVAGFAAGIVTGLFGGGGGMILVPLLTALTDLDDRNIFPASIAIILPICLVSLAVTVLRGAIPWEPALPYLLGSTVGGVLAGKYGKHIPTVWLHRILGGMILWGGFRYLC